MINIIKKLMLIIYIIISFIVLFNMYNNDYFSYNNKRPYDTGITRGHDTISDKRWAQKKYYKDIKLDNNEYTFSFYRDYMDKYQQKSFLKYDYYGALIIKQNATGNKKTILYIYEKLDSYVEFVANNKIRINGYMYLDIDRDGYVYQDEVRNIGGRYIYLVVVPFLILFVFNVPCIGLSILIDFGLIIEMILSLYF